MRRSNLPLLLVFAARAAAAGGPDDEEVPPPQVCEDHYASCKEECTINWGTSFTTREKLGKCVVICNRNHDHCLERWMELNRDKVHGQSIEEEHGAPTRYADPKPTYPTDPAPPEPTPRSGEADGVNRSATPGSELGPAVDKNPEAYPTADDKRRAAAPSDAGTASPPRKSEAKGQAKASPPPAAKKSEPTPKPKKDLSEWDPGDIK